MIVDAAMLSALLQAMLDWSFEHARAAITVRLELKSWPEHARLSCRFAHAPPDEVMAHAASPGGLPLPARRTSSTPCRGSCCAGWCRRWAW